MAENGLTRYQVRRELSPFVGLFGSKLMKLDFDDALFLDQKGVESVEILC